MRSKKYAQRLKTSGESRFFLSLEMERKPGHEIELFHP